MSLNVIRYLALMRGWYLLGSSRSCFPAALLSPLGLNTSPCWTEEKLRSVQPVLTESLLAYWWGWALTDLHWKHTGKRRSIHLYCHLSDNLNLNYDMFQFQFRSYRPTGLHGSGCPSMSMETLTSPLMGRFWRTSITSLYQPQKHSVSLWSAGTPPSSIPSSPSTHRYSHNCFNQCKLSQKHFLNIFHSFKCCVCFISSRVAEVQGGAAWKQCWRL